MLFTISSMGTGLAEQIVASQDILNNYYVLEMEVF